MDTKTNTGVQSLRLGEQETFSNLLSIAMTTQYGLAFWRLPGSDTKHAILSNQISTLAPDATVEDLTTGFIMAPFDKMKERLFLEADYTFTFRENALADPKTSKEHASVVWLLDQIKSPLPDFILPHRVIPSPEEKIKETFCGLVAKCLDEIQNGRFEKIVPSRVKTVSLRKDFDIVHAFNSLCAANPNAFISLIHIPTVGIWIGASPEILVGIENRKVFRTVALAGTQPFIAGVDLKSVAWTQKEIEEQALVERYIISCFKKIRLREYEEHGPRTVVAGNLIHLKSDFSVDMEATNFPQLGSVMLGLLHPTSAVCGMPNESSNEFLRQHEGYDREYYTGYLGPVNYGDCTHLYVNLRCAQLTNTTAILYAGAGVTRDSVPEHEWAETEIKLNNLMQIIA